MAIQWGAYAGHFRLGIDISVSGQNMTIVVYGENESGYSHNWNSVLSFGGSWSGSKTVSMSTGLAVSRRELHRSGATFTGTRSYSASLPVPYWGGTASVSRSVTISPPPAPKPNAPSGLRVVRISDTEHRLEWSRNSTYTSVQIFRKTNNGSYQRIGTAAGNAATWTNKTTKANERYAYYVIGVNANGSSPQSNTTPYVYTTPPAPVLDSVSRVGNNMVLTARDRAAFPNGLGWRVYDGGALIASPSSMPWTHTAPAAGEHRYRVANVMASNASGGQSLTSAQSNEVRVTALAAPKAPSSLSPNGEYRSGAAVAATWRHNPVDSSAQTQYQLQWRAVGAPSWNTLAAVPSGTSAGSFPVAGIAGAVEWQVRTKGVHVDWSPWSATARVTITDPPEVTILAPGAIVDTTAASVSWAYYQSADFPQEAWELELFDGTGQVLGQASGSGNATSHTMATRLVDGQSYAARVRVSSVGMWSEWAEIAFRAEFLPPFPPVLVAGWSEEVGAAALNISPWPGGPGESVTNLFTNPNFKGSGSFVEVRRNARVNPGFEGGRVAGWAYIGDVTLTATTETAHGGQHSCRVAASRASFGWGIFSAPFGEVGAHPMQCPNGVVTGSAWVKGAPGADLRFELRSRNASGSQIGGDAKTFTATGEWQRVSLSSDAFTPGSYVVIGVALNYASGAPATFWVDDFLVEWSPSLGDYFDGSSAPNSVDPDMRQRWLGDPGTSQSVMEGETVASVSPVRCVAIVSEVDGASAMRLIATNTYKTEGDSNSFAMFDIPGVAQGGGTFVATRTQRHALTGPTSADRIGVHVQAPFHVVAGEEYNVPGTNELRIMYPSLSGPYRAAMGHGGALGSGDVWWTLPTLVAGEYAGPGFSGNTGMIDNDGMALYPRWDGVPNESTTTAVAGVAAVSFAIERSVDGGVTWELVAADLLDASALTDWECLSNGETHYRATSYAATGATSDVIEIVFADSQAVWLSGGEAFGMAARLPFDPDKGVQVSRERGMHRFAGRSRGVPWSGEHTSRSVDSSGTLIDDDPEVSSPEWLEQVAFADAPTHLYRDPRGERMYGSLGPVSISRGKGPTLWRYSFQIDETERG